MSPDKGLIFFVCFLTALCLHLFTFRKIIRFQVCYRGNTLFYYAIRFLWRLMLKLNYGQNSSNKRRYRIVSFHRKIFSLCLNLLYQCATYWKTLGIPSLGYLGPLMLWLTVYRKIIKMQYIHASEKKKVGLQKISLWTARCNPFIDNTNSSFKCYFEE